MEEQGTWVSSLAIIVFKVYIWPLNLPGLLKCTVKVHT